MRNEGSLDLLFENLTGTYFWVKNTAFQFVMCNQLIADICGCKKPDEVAGKTDFDFFPTEISNNFRKDDAAIINGKKGVRNRTEILVDPDGRVDWYVTNKLPMYAKNGSVIGVAGTTRRLPKDFFLEQPYSELAAVISYIQDNYARQVDVKYLAGLAGLSVSQFEIKFARIFQTTPKKFIIKTRVKASCESLIKSKASINYIALDYGFYDQSHYSNQFSVLIGITPKQFRRRYRSQA